MNWWIIVSNGRVSEEKYHISSSLVVIIVHGEQPPRSWSTLKIGCHYSPQSLSTAAIRIHHQLPPQSWSTPIIRCQHDTGYVITIMVSQHDTESAIQVPPLRSWSLIICIAFPLKCLLESGLLFFRTLLFRKSFCIAVSHLFHLFIHCLYGQ